MEKEPKRTNHNGSELHRLKLMQEGYDVALFEKLYKSVGYNAALTNTIYNDLRKIRKNIILNKVVELINRIPIINLLYIKYKR